MAEDQIDGGWVARERAADDRARKKIFGVSRKQRHPAYRGNHGHRHRKIVYLVSGVDVEARSRDELVDDHFDRRGSARYGYEVLTRDSRGSISSSGARR